MKKVNIYLAEGFEEIEAIAVADVLRRARIDVRMVSITGGHEVKGGHGIVVAADELFENADNMGADMLVLPGGMPGTKNLGEHEGLREVLRSFAKEKKYMAAICAAPSVPGSLGLLNGKLAVCYPGFEDELKGATIGKGIVVQDENYITSKGPGTAIYFALKLAGILAGEERAEELRNSMIVQG
ncbi:MAG: DJ-1 family glyoxalase III [Pseudomonadota bacterium]